MNSLRVLITPEWGDSASVCSWVKLDEHNAIIDSGFGTLASLPKDIPLIAIAASELLLCTEVTVPKVSYRKLEKVLPYAVEDIVLEDVDNIHIVPLSHDKDKVRVCITSRTWLEKFIAACRQANLKLSKVVPEYALVQVTADEWHVIYSQDRSFLVMEDGLGLSLGAIQDLPSLLSLLNLVTSKQDTVKLRHVVLHAVDNSPNLDVSNANSSNFILREGTRWSWKKATISNSLNLLVGKFTQRFELDVWSKRLRPLVLVTLLLCIVQILAINLFWAKLSWEQRELDQKMVELLKETLGTNVTIVSPHAQMSRALAQQRHQHGLMDESDFLPMTSRLSGYLSEIKDAQLSAAKYLDGVYDIEVQLRNHEDWVILKQKLLASFTVTEVSKRDANGNFVVRVRVALLG